MYLVTDKFILHSQSDLRPDCNVDIEKTPHQVVSTSFFELVLFLTQEKTLTSKVPRLCAKCILPGEMTPGGWRQELLSPPSEIPDFPLDLLEVEQGIYPRFRTSEETVEQYRDAMEQGEQFPPIEVAYHRGRFILLDGFHRVAAYRRLFEEQKEMDSTKIVPTFPARIHEVKSELELYILAVQFNTRHGLPLSREEKRQFARKLYEMGLHDLKEIANVLAVSVRTLYRWLDDLLKQSREERERLKERAVKLYKEGWTQENIAKELNVPRQTISDWIKQILPNFDKWQKSAKLTDYEQTDKEDWESLSFSDEESIVLDAKVDAWDEEKIRKAIAFFFKFRDELYQLAKEYESVREEIGYVFRYEQIARLLSEMEEFDALKALYDIIHLLDYLRKSEPFNRRVRYPFISADAILQSDIDDMRLMGPIR